MRLHWRVLCCAVFLATLHPMLVLAQGSVQGSRALVVDIINEPLHLDYTRSFGSYRWFISDNIMAGLYQRTAEGQTVAVLAASHEVSPDGLTHTIKLRPGVTWSDGVPLKASHFRDAWMRQLDPKSDSGEGERLYFIRGAKKYKAGKLSAKRTVAIEALDDSTLRFQVRHGMVDVKQWLCDDSFLPIRLDLLNRFGEAYWRDVSKMAVLGPYVPSSWTAGESITLERNPRYFGSPAPIARVRFVFINDPIALLSALKDRTVDVSFNLKRTLRLNLEVANAPYVFTEAPAEMTFALTLFVNKLSDKNLRLAIKNALDLNEMKKRLDQNVDIARTFVPPTMLEDSLRPAPSVNIERARQLLSLVVDKSYKTRPLSLTFTPRSREVATAVADQLQSSLGINVQLAERTPNNLVRESKEGRHDMAIIGSQPYPHPMLYLWTYRSDSLLNYSHYKSREYDRLVYAGIKSLKNADNQEYTRIAQKTILDSDVALIPLFHPRYLLALSKDVEGVSLTPQLHLYLQNARFSGNR